MSAPISPLRILLADDSRTQAIVMKLHLERAGHVVDVAEDGLKAVEKIFSTRPDLVVSDVEMPFFTGYQICRLVKDDSFTRGIPIILLTSLSERKDSFWGHSSGADFYLTKGPRPEEVVESINEFIAEKGIRPRPLDSGDTAVGGPDVIGRVVRLLDWRLFEMTVIKLIGDLVGTIHDHRETVFSLLALTARILEYDVGGILLFDEGGLRLYLSAPDALSRGDVESFVTWAKTEASLLGHDQKEVHLILREDQHPRDVASPLYPEGREVSLPLMRGDEIEGMIRLLIPGGRDPSEASLEIFRLIAKHGNLVVQYALLYSKARMMSVTDGLTGLYNHRFFQESIRNMHARSLRSDVPYALIMVDIDHFKTFNDTYGHQQGDVVLKTLAKLMKECFREVDVIARYGGEEFAILLPDTRIEGVSAVAERLRLKVEGHAFPGPSGPLQVTISVGYASFPEDPAKNVAEIICRADQALYKAKESGRNRVEHL